MNNRNTLFKRIRASLMALLTAAGMIVSLQRISAAPEDIADCRMAWNFTATIGNPGRALDFARHLLALEYYLRSSDNERSFIVLDGFILSLPTPARVPLWRLQIRLLQRMQEDWENFTMKRESLAKQFLEASLRLHFGGASPEDSALFDRRMQDLNLEQKHRMLAICRALGNFPVFMMLLYNYSPDLMRGHADRELLFKAFGCLGIPDMLQEVQQYLAVDRELAKKFPEARERFAETIGWKEKEKESVQMTWDIAPREKNTSKKRYSEIIHWGPGKVIHEAPPAEIEDSEFELLTISGDGEQSSSTGRSSDKP